MSTSVTTLSHFERENISAFSPSSIDRGYHNAITTGGPRITAKSQAIFQTEILTLFGQTDFPQTVLRMGYGQQMSHVPCVPSSHWTALHMHKKPEAHNQITKTNTLVNKL